MIFGQIRKAGLKLKLLKYVSLNNPLSREPDIHFKGKGSFSSKSCPQNDMTETRHIIDLASYYRKFIANFSNIVRSLIQLTKKKHTTCLSPIMLGKL